MPSPRIHVAGRIAEARKRVGLDAARVAQELGLSIAAYDDLEAYDDEAYMSVSLDQLRSLGKLLNIAPRSLVAAGGLNLDSEDLSPVQLVSHIREYLGARTLSIEQFEDQVGWRVSPVMDNPDALWQAWNADALHDVCEPLAIAWLTVIPKCAA
jgi:transcriptional regulator with XRE-family HTH domain